MNARISNPISPLSPSPKEIIPQRHKRRASDIPDRIESRALVSDPLVPTLLAPELLETADRPPAVRQSYPASAGSLLIVQDTTGGRNDLGYVSRLAGIQVIQVKTHDEAIQILLKREFRIDLLLVIHQSSTSPSSAALIRKCLEIRPGLQVVMMVDCGCQEDMRSGYDAGATSIILNSISEERLISFLQRSLFIAQEAQRQELRRRERRERHASDTMARRCIRRITSWVDAPVGSRRKAGLATVITVATALVIGMGVAYALDQSYRTTDRYESIANRIVEGRSPSRASNNTVEGAVLRWQASQQIELAREANEETRRYYQRHLEELRWQNYSRSSPTPEPVASPPWAVQAGWSEILQRSVSDEHSSGRERRSPTGSAH